MQAAAPHLLALLLTAAAAPAWPHSCPLEIYKIDQALSTSKNLDPALIKKVRDLRAEGEKLHFLETSLRLWPAIHYEPSTRFKSRRRWLSPRRRFHLATGEPGKRQPAS